MKRCRFVVTGASGQLGRSLRVALGGEDDRVFLSRAELDLQDPEAIKRVIGSLDFDVLVNAAAFTAVDAAESAEVMARKINTTAALHLAEQCKLKQARMVHVSTDFVFDGKAGSPISTSAERRPLSAYGRTKRDGEDAVLSILGSDAVIARTAWLYAAGGRNFVATILRLLRTQETVKVVADQVGSPTWAMTLANGIVGLADAGGEGIFHVTDAGVASWYDFAVAIRELGLSHGLVEAAASIEPISTSQFPTPAARPAYSVMDTSRTAATLGCKAMHWRESLDRCLAGWPSDDS